MYPLYTGVCMYPLYTGVCMYPLYTGVCMHSLYSDICMYRLYTGVCMYAGVGVCGGTCLLFVYMLPLFPSPYSVQKV